MEQENIDERLLLKILINIIIGYYFVPPTTLNGSFKKKKNVMTWKILAKFKRDIPTYIDEYISIINKIQSHIQERFKNFMTIQLFLEIYKTHLIATFHSTFLNLIGTKYILRSI